MEQDRRGLEFVAEHGTPWERWRARRLLGAAEPLPPDWAAAQNLDGGWPSREFRGGLSNMGTTSVTLMRMAFTGIGQSPEAGRTVEFLWRVQREDGRWTEDPAQAAYAPPAWNAPGSLAVDLWETANNAAVLGALRFASDPRVRRAVDWVEAHAREDGTFPGYHHTAYAMASVRSGRGEAARAERYLGVARRVLEQSARSDWFDTMDLT